MGNETWHQAAREALDGLISRGDPFTADDLVALVGHPDPGHNPNRRNNQIGSMFREAASSGRITTVGITRSSTPTRKGGTIRVWQARG